MGYRHYYCYCYPDWGNARTEGTTGYCVDAIKMVHNPMTKGPVILTESHE